MSETKQFVPKFDGEGGWAEAERQFPDRVERSLRVSARSYYDEACRKKSHALSLRDQADALEREGKDDLMWAMRCEKAADEIAAPPLLAVSDVSQDALRERVGRLGHVRVANALVMPAGQLEADRFRVIDTFILAHPQLSSRMLAAIEAACDRVEGKGGGDV